MTVYNLLNEVTADLRYLAEHDDEGALRVAALIVERLAVGHRQYGCLDPVNDKRDWRREKRQEDLDSLVYGVCEDIRNEATANAPVAR